ncbi:uncharacterized protein ATC70_010951 [Mucor velutinosus]|uniref:Homeobox domain-containing protein n=1 Tax=Mucor velutinosus TaxID=708070 RepID=A0AAN7HTF1_9FUNG|nr:hypothetical protein ATC70_010951 [Mucor velutinosus]
MTRPKRKVTSRKVPQKVALPAYRYLPSKSPSPDEAPQTSGSTESGGGESSSSGSVDQDEDPNESGTDQSHTTSSPGDFPPILVHPRQRFTADETTALEQVYRRNKRPSNEIKQRLARRFNTSMSRIQIWFQNRRAKEKRNNSNPSNQRASTAGEQDQDGDKSAPSDDPKQPEPSTSAATSSSSARRRRVPRKPSASPPVDAESSSSAAKKRKKQKVPVVPTHYPATHPFLSSGSYAFTYPESAAAPMQSIDSPNLSSPPGPNENFLYLGHPPAQARGGFFVPNFDWHHSHMIHPSFTQVLQGPHTTEKLIKYVDPKNVVNSESSQPVVGQRGEQGTASSSKSFSRKGKQKQNGTDMTDPDPEQDFRGE